MNEADEKFVRAYRRRNHQGQRGRVMSTKEPTVDEKMREYMLGRPGVTGIFHDHNCAYCDSGAKPCIRGNPKGREWNCEFPYARND